MYFGLLRDHGELTVPQRLGTMKSFGSLSVKAIRLDRNVSLVFVTFTSSITKRNAGSRPSLDAPKGNWDNILHRSLRNGYPPPIEVFRQALVELREPSKLQFRHRLLLAFASIIGTDFVRGGHHVRFARAVFSRGRGLTGSGSFVVVCCRVWRWGESDMDARVGISAQRRRDDGGVLL